MAIVEHFEVIYDKPEVAKICTSGYYKHRHGPINFIIINL
jgi:hypothetical protein